MTGPTGLLVRGVAVLALLVAAFFAGDKIGANRVIARQAKVAARIEAARVRIDAQGHRLARAAAARNAQREIVTREIYRALPTTVDRPVYRNLCIDDDGVRLLERAAANANGVDRREPDRAAAAAAGTADVR